MALSNVKQGTFIKINTSKTGSGVVSVSSSSATFRIYIEPSSGSVANYDGVYCRFNDRQGNTIWNTTLTGVGFGAFERSFTTSTSNASGRTIKVDFACADNRGDTRYSASADITATLPQTPTFNPTFKRVPQTTTTVRIAMTNFSLPNREVVSYQGKHGGALDEYTYSMPGISSWNMDYLQLPVNFKHSLKVGVAQNAQSSWMSAYIRDVPNVYPNYTVLYKPNLTTSYNSSTRELTVNFKAFTNLGNISLGNGTMRMVDAKTGASIATKSISVKANSTQKFTDVSEYRKVQIYVDITFTYHDGTSKTETTNKVSFGKDPATNMQIKLNGKTTRIANLQYKQDGKLLNVTQMWIKEDRNKSTVVPTGVTNPYGGLFGGMKASDYPRGFPVLMGERMHYNNDNPKAINNMVRFYFNKVFVGTVELGYYQDDGVFKRLQYANNTTTDWLTLYPSYADLQEMKGKEQVLRLTPEAGMELLEVMYTDKKIILGEV